MTAEGETPSVITGHPFVASWDDWWNLCTHFGCGLSMAAHTEVGLNAFNAMRAEIDGLPYRCPNCVTKGVDPCPHQGGGA